MRGTGKAANVVASIALFAALGGRAYAATSTFVGEHGAIQGCVPGRGGPLTVVNAGRHCPNCAARGGPKVTSMRTESTGATLGLVCGPFVTRNPAPRGDVTLGRSQF